MCELLGNCYYISSIDTKSLAYTFSKSRICLVPELWKSIFENWTTKIEWHRRNSFIGISSLFNWKICQPSDMVLGQLCRHILKSDHFDPCNDMEQQLLAFKARDFFRSESLRCFHQILQSNDSGQARTESKCTTSIWFFSRFQAIVSK